MRKKIMFVVMTLLSSILISCSDGATDDNPSAADDDKSFIEEDDASTVISSGGFYVANEGQYTNQTGGGAMKSDASLNYLGNDGQIDYRIFRAVNSEEKLVVATHFSTIWGGNIYFVSREQVTTLTIVDAQTLEKKTSISIAAAAGRAFTGINDKLAYLSCTKGIYKVDLETMQLSNAIEGIMEQVGNMCSAGKYVFAVAAKTVYVIDVATSTVKEKIDGDFWTLVRSKDGNIWVATKTDFLKINPVTLERERVSYPEGMAVAEDSNKGLSINGDMWNTWHAGSLCASTQNNVLYWANEAKTDIIRYDIDSKEAKIIYKLSQFEDDGDLIQLFLYRGACMRVDPISDNLVVVATGKGAGWNAGFNKVYRLKADGTLDGDVIDLKGGNGEYSGSNAGPGFDYMWCPAMPFFKDVNMPQILIKRIVITANKTLKIDLKDKVIDADNTAASILHDVEFPENDLVTYTLTDDGILTIAAKGKAGSVDCKLTAISNGKRVERTVKVDVTLN